MNRVWIIGPTSSWLLSDTFNFVFAEESNMTHSPVVVLTAFTVSQNISLENFQIFWGERFGMTLYKASIDSIHKLCKLVREW